jgi:hypothetical protein
MMSGITHDETDQSTIIKGLIDALSDRDKLRAAKARRSLIRLGERAIPALVQALNSPQHQTR